MNRLNQNGLRSRLTSVRLGFHSDGEIRCGNVQTDFYRVLFLTLFRVPTGNAFRRWIMSSKRIALRA